MSTASGPRRLFEGVAYELFCPKCGAYSNKYGSQVTDLSRFITLRYRLSSACLCRKSSLHL